MISLDLCLKSLSFLSYLIIANQLTSWPFEHLQTRLAYPNYLYNWSISSPPFLFIARVFVYLRGINKRSPDHGRAQNVQLERTQRWGRSATAEWTWRWVGIGKDHQKIQYGEWIYFSPVRWSTYSRIKKPFRRDVVENRIAETVSFGYRKSRK